ncbi:TPR Domain containing protein [Trichomonas vaginalis G3]|uniref:TPR Domain containing protein n=1 Tax=Trichomonas vaginalis (strain ATCC PRA-98 / G3) TaxID=412133 RepID=A2G056_TRIV3|nr:TPR-like family [Trichomonas vaginalis G3]EAX89458.1 TPR Domain containing protein [Trichomonas vaginalis G3]KAI5485305.1 TPR-like family [Trichomonas vaginalis G3]|eukprot:XP_001302388.1 TPR Domain containing protein [Trichomonas vaginalis G3]
MEAGNIADVLKSLMGTIGKPIGSNEYPKYHMDYQIASEMNFLNIHYPGISQERMRAFEIGNKADNAYLSGNTKDATEMCWKAISLDGNAWDAYRVLVRSLETYIGDDHLTMIMAGRELVRVEREIFKDILTMDNKDFYKYSMGRPYIRLLSNISSFSFDGKYNDVHVKAYEENLRINRYDNTEVRSPLLMAYLNCAIVNKYHLKNYGIWPERTENHINAMFKTPLLPDMREGCWGDNYKNDTLYTWYQIIFKYMNKDPSWVNLVKREDKQNPKLLKALLSEEEFEGDIIDPMNKNPKLLKALLSEEEFEAVQVENTLLSPVIYRVPNFMGDLFKAVRNKPIYNRAQKDIAALLYGMEEIQPNWKAKAEKALNEARELMRNRQFMKAIEKLSDAKKYYNRSIYPSMHIENSGIPFAIFSNRAQSAFQVGRFDLARFDARMALYLNPKIPHIYKILPLIAEKYYCPKSKEFLAQIANEATQEHIDEEWKELSMKAIGRLGMKALIGERVGFSAKLIEAETKRGFEDMFEPISFKPKEFELLPWLTENDIEQGVI